MAPSAAAKLADATAGVKQYCCRIVRDFDDRSFERACHMRNRVLSQMLQVVRRLVPGERVELPDRPQELANRHCPKREQKEKLLIN